MVPGCAPQSGTSAEPVFAQQKLLRGFFTTPLRHEGTRADSLQALSRQAADKLGLEAGTWPALEADFEPLTFYPPDRWIAPAISLPEQGMGGVLELDHDAMNAYHVQAKVRP